MEKENTVFTELNDRLVKHYYQDKSESFFQVNGVEFVLTISHYCNVLTIETIKVVTLGYVVTLSNYAKKPLRLPKKVTLRDAKENVDKVRSEVQKTSEKR